MVERENNAAIDEHDAERIYCRKLGHHLTFHYCRSTAGDTLCEKILDCWFERFDLEAYLKAHYSREELDRLGKPPEPKMTSLISLIEKARRNRV